MIIIITGTPGTGKTTYAKELASKKGYKYIDVSELIKKHKLGEKKNKELDYVEVDTDKLNKVLIEIINQANKNKISLVIDSHLSHYLPKEYVDKCIVMICGDRKELKKRLHKRKYSYKKIEENLEAEIMESCLHDALKFGHDVEVIDSSE